MTLFYHHIAEKFGRLGSLFYLFIFIQFRIHIVSVLGVRVSKKNVAIFFLLGVGEIVTLAEGNN